MSMPDHIRAHTHSIRRREEILGSASCGCFFWCSIFASAEIMEWVDEWGRVGQTANCPRCGIDSVIGDASGYPITVEFLTEMKRHWF